MISLDLSAFLFNNLNENARNEFKYTCQCYKLERLRKDMFHLFYAKYQIKCL